MVLADHGRAVAILAQDPGNRRGAVRDEGSVAGVLVGGTLAFFAARWLQPLLFRQTARDPIVFGVVAVLLLAVAAVASLVPAVRATRADPNSTLRAD